MQQVIEAILSLSKNIRYVAIYHDKELSVSSKANSLGASSSESDKYEELIVNPTILTLAKQRGDIDCGGSKFVLIRYGNFFQIVIPLAKGHVSVCVEPYADPLTLVEPIQNILIQNSLS